MKAKTDSTSKAGSYYKPHPLDFELLRRMPREGAVLGFRTLAMTVSHVKKELNKDAPQGGLLTAPQIASRLVSMKHAGYVVNVPIFGPPGQGWQRTLKGEKHYEDQTGKRIGDAAPELKVVEGGGS